MDWTEKLAQLVTEHGPNVVYALIVLIAGFIAAKAIRGLVRRALGRTRLDATLIPFVTGLVYYALLVFVVLAVLGRFGIQTASFIAVLGAAGFAVGLAMQGTLSNFAAGVMLLIFRPFKVGDVIEAGGSVGTVREIGIFATVLDSPDNVRIVLPNSGVYGQVVKNFSFNDTRRIDLVVGVSYDDDLSRAVEAVRSVLGADPRVLAEPAAVVAVSELADSSVNFVVRPWCKREDYWTLRWDLTRALKQELERAGCSIPFPQRDVHLHRGDAGPLAAFGATG